MTTLSERLNMAAGDVSSELSFETLVINKKAMTDGDISNAVNDFFHSEDLDDDELLSVSEIIGDFSSEARLPFGGEMSIWFDACVEV